MLKYLGTPYMKENKETKDWLEELGEKFLHKVGLKKGQKVLDFGCGIGDYTIPAAKIVRGKGKIYALDKDRESLNFLLGRAKRYGLKNIEIIKTSGQLKIGLKDESLNMVLLYDVIHNSYFPGMEERKELLDEVQRILKKDGIVSLYPKHAIAGDIKKEVENARFSFARKFQTVLLHDSCLTKDYIFNFSKV